MDRLRALSSHALVGTFGPAIAILAVQRVFFGAPAGILLSGATIGLLTALIAVGMALVYRANRIVNFAQADLGYVPGLLGVMLVVFSGFNYFLGFFIGLLVSIALGALVELAIIRRFFRAPRLILTVATIGLAQLAAAGSFLLVGLWDAPSASQRIDTPGLHFTIKVFPLILEADYVVAWVVGLAAIVGVGLFLRRTAIGSAIRAAADSADRASLLGVPVRRLHTIVWAVAAALSFLGLWLRASIIGLPIGSSLGLLVLVRALAALMLGRTTNLPAIVTSAIALGVLESAVTFSANSTATAPAVLAFVVIATLLIRGRAVTRAERDESSSWQAAEEVRPVPPEMRKVREVQAVRFLVGAAVVAAVAVLPHLLNTEDSLKASAVGIYAIIGISVIVLTGWAGQVSLGQMGFVAWGSAVTAKLSTQWEADLLVSLLVATVVGALVAVVVGLPALRLRGLYLAVTTLAFSLATIEYLLNDEFFSWVEDGRFERVPLLGRIDLTSPTSIYYVVAGGLLVVVVALRGIRRSRTGRVLVALRENEAAAQSFGVSPTRAKLTAFAISGAVAAFAGGLFAYHQQAFDPITYSPEASIAVFTVAVVGGLGTLVGGVLGALYFLGGRWFLPGDWAILSTGLGVLLVLLVLPSGLGGLAFGLRDRWLRAVAKRRGIRSPSLLADGSIE